jgi:phospholipase/carboxylesterase
VCYVFRIKNGNHKKGEGKDVIIGPNPGTQESQMMVILLHGYGSWGENMADLAYALDMPSVTFWCPDGPEVCDEYAPGRQWFSLRGVDWHVSDLHQAWQGIGGLLADAARKFHAQMQVRFPNYLGPVVVGGFSQGAMMAYELGLFHPNFKGILGFSGVYCVTKVLEYRPQVFWSHAQDDEVVPCSWMEQSHELLAKNAISAHKYITPHGGHSISRDALMASRTFLQKIGQGLAEFPGGKSPA